MILTIPLIYLHQTLRFVKSLPKRERQPLANKFKNADPEGMYILGRLRISADME